MTSANPKSSFTTQNPNGHKTKFLRKLFAIKARALKKVRQPCPRLKRCKEYPFEVAPID